jgi:hypothetical protein
MAPVELPQAGVSVDVCGVCRGIWFDWFDGEVGALSQHLDTDAVAGAGNNPQPRCPRDDAPLLRLPYLHQGPLVARCPVCFGLYAPREQVAELQRYHRRMPLDPEEPLERRSLLARLWYSFSG